MSGRKWLSFATVGWLLASFRLSYAHHPTIEQYPSHARIATQSMLDYGFGRYSHDGVHADVMSWNLGGEYAFRNRSSLGLRLGLHRVERDGGDAETGIGDLDLALKVRLTEADHHTGWIGGLGLEIPTGDEDKGLGSGHVELSPFASFMNRAGRLNVHGSLAGIFSLEDEHGHGSSAHVNFINPHEEKEIQGHIGASFHTAARTYLNVVLAGALPAAGDHKWDAFVDARPELGLLLDNGWTIALSGQVPLTHERWFDYRSVLQVRKMFHP